MGHIVVGTAGHIDHGKSSLVHALTGVDPDRLKEEKRRGITIELGFAHSEIGQHTLAFIDVPGHERFVKAMLAGVGGIDCVMLVVAADESVMPQTREHFQICSLLNVQHGLVVLTKSDLVDAEMLELVTLEVSDLVKGSFLEGAPVIPVSTRTLSGLDLLRGSLAAIAGRAPEHNATGAVRMPIDRVFSMQGFGTVVTGTLASGTIRVDSELTILPSGRAVRVRGVQVHGRKAHEVLAGQRAAINLGGIDVTEVARGETLTVGGALSTTRRIDAAFNLLDTAAPLKHGTRIRFHCGTTELLGRVSAVGEDPTPIAPGTTRSVQIRLAQPAAVTRGDRFVIRSYSPSNTIGGGQVLDPQPHRGSVRSAAAEKRFAMLAISTAKAGDLTAIRQMVLDAGSSGLPVEALSSRAGIAPSSVAATINQLQNDGVRLAGGFLIGSESVGDLSARLLTALTDFHHEQPLAGGMPREEARERVFRRVPHAIFESVLGDLTRAKRLSVGDRISLVDGTVLAADESRAIGSIEAAFKEAGLKPPALGSFGCDSVRLEKITAFLVRQKRLARLDGLVFHIDSLIQLKSEIEAMKLTAAGNQVLTIDVATFKDRYGLSRKFAIPLLEWLDREKVTRRLGENRVIL